MTERKKPNCESCDFGKHYAKSYDIHFDINDCPINCERNKRTGTLSKTEKVGE